MLNNNLQSILNDLQITQTQMANDLGMSRQQLSNILNGRSNLIIEHLLKLYEKYNVNLHFILTGQGEHFIKNNQNKEIIQLTLKKNQIAQINYD